MANGLLKAFNIEAEESKGVLIFIIQSVFIGIFYGIFEITANTLFLDHFKPEMLTKAYAVSGFFGIILTLIYSKLHEKIKFSNVAVINLSFIVALTFLARFAFNAFDIKVIVFILLVIYGPLRIVALVGFWGAIGRIFSLRQGKRLFGLIDSGWIFGIILSSYLVPVLLNFNFKTENLLIISAFSILLALITQIILSKNFNLNLEETASSEKSKESRLLEILKNPYILVISVFVSLSMVTAFFIHYSFMAVTKDNYPDSKEFAMFLGFFLGTMMIFILLIKTFVYSRLIKTYGLKIALIISPGLLIFFTLLASVIGSVFGYSSASASFMLFFMLIALSKLFASALKDAIEVPSFKILYQSIDKSIRYNVQAKVDGTINEIAALFTGILLALLGLLPFFRVIHFSFFLIGVLVLWLVFAIRLYKQYQLSLQKALSEAKSGEIADDPEIAGRINIIADKLITSGDEKKKELLRYYELANPLEYEKFILAHYKREESIAIKKFILQEIKRLGIFEADNLLAFIINNEKGQDLINYAKELEESFHNNYQLKKDAEKQTEKLANSASWDDKYTACKLIRKSKNPDNIPFLNKLLRDFNREIKTEAIKTSSNLYNNDTIALLIEMLSREDLANYAASALTKIGAEAIDQLEQAFYKTGIEASVLSRITEILGRIDGQKSIKSLINKLGHVDSNIQNNAIVSLRRKNYIPDETTNLHLHESIENQIGVIGWNIAAHLTGEENHTSELLISALQNEIENSYNKLFLLLSLTYDPRSIEHVKENLESETAEGIGFAIELLDQFIYDELKPKLFPLLEDTPAYDKIKQLQNNYPVDKSSIPEIFYDIINRDLNQINHWTKACALNELILMENVEINNAIIAQLFNPDELLREMAAKLIYKNNESLFHQTVTRLNKNIQNELIEKMIHNPDYLPLFERIILLRNCHFISSLPGNTIYKILQNSRYETTEPNQEIEITEDSSLILLTKGNTGLYVNKNLIKQFGENQEINLFGIKNGGIDKLSLISQEGSSFFIMNYLKFSKLLNEDINFSKTILNI